MFGGNFSNFDSTMQINSKGLESSKSHIHTPKGKSTYHSPMRIALINQIHRKMFHHFCSLCRINQSKKNKIALITPGKVGKVIIVQWALILISKIKLLYLRKNGINHKSSLWKSSLISNKLNQYHLSKQYHQNQSLKTYLKNQFRKAL